MDKKLRKKYHLSIMIELLLDKMRSFYLKIIIKMSKIHLIVRFLFSNTIKIINFIIIIRGFCLGRIELVIRYN